MSTSEMIQQQSDVAVAEPTRPETLWKPRVNIVESPNAYRIEAEMPGVPEGKAEVIVEKNQLVLRGAVEPAAGVNSRIQFRSGRFERFFRLPGTVNAEKITAQLRNGVLLVTLPKREELKPRTIPVKG